MEQRTTLVYDGDCGFCTTAANWISRRWPETDGPTAVPWQYLSPDAIAEVRLSQDDLKRTAWWLDDNTREEGSRAVARALVAAGGLWAIVGWVRGPADLMGCSAGLSGRGSLSLPTPRRDTGVQGMTHRTGRVAHPGGSRHIVVTVGPPSGSANAPLTSKPTDSYLRRFPGLVDSR